MFFLIVQEKWLVSTYSCTVLKFSMFLLELVLHDNKSTSFKINSISAATVRPSQLVNVKMLKLFNYLFDWAEIMQKVFKNFNI